MNMAERLKSCLSRDALNFVLTNRIPRAALTRFAGWFSLPLPVAAAHNGGAAALVILLVLINYRVRASRSNAIPE